MIYCNANSTSQFTPTHIFFRLIVQNKVQKQFIILLIHYTESNSYRELTFATMNEFLWIEFLDKRCAQISKLRKVINKSPGIELKWKKMFNFYSESESIGINLLRIENICVITHCDCDTNIVPLLSPMVLHSVFAHNWCAVHCLHSTVHCFRK